MKIFSDYNLEKLNTFGIKVQAKYFVEIKEEKDLIELFSSPIFKENQKLFLGGGSNLLFTKDFDGLVILNKFLGIEIIEENSDFVFIKAQGGEDWQNLVSFSVDRDFWGLENLTSIPGTVGASPVQNIGAYGTEIKDVLEKVEAFEIETGLKRIFSNSECLFNYRDSIFKNSLKGKYFISAVIFKLSKKTTGIEMYSGGENKKIYPALKKYLQENNLKIKNSKDISQAVAEIRQSKLPDPKILGNAGSFFKNVYVDQKKFNELKKEFPEMPFFEEYLVNPVRSRPREASATVTLGRPASNRVKIPSGWLIEQCGWKGKRIGNVGVHEKQALVLVNYGGASGGELFDLAQQIIDSVYQKFNLKLEMEVNLI